MKLLTKFAFPVILLAVSLFMILRATVSTAAHMKLPSDLSEPIARVKIAGKVAPSSIEYKTNPELLLTFAVTDPAKDMQGNPHQIDPTIQIPIQYKGLKPDMFQEGRDVLLEGEYDGKVFYAKSLQTQCPSKYEPPTPQKQ